VGVEFEIVKVGKDGGALSRKRTMSVKVLEGLLVSLCQEPGIVV